MATRNMTTVIASPSAAGALASVPEMDAALMEKVVMEGDLAQLRPVERLQYYAALCRSLGLNPLSRPFRYIEFEGKLQLYAAKDCTEQLRERKNISIRITNRERVDDMYIVTAHARTAQGREDEATGVMPLSKEKGDWKESKTGKRYFAKTGEWTPLAGVDLANAMKKCETQAKRRVTLSICGLGMIDESEIEHVRNAVHVEIDESGAITDTSAIAAALADAIDRAGDNESLATARQQIAAAAGSINDAQKKDLRARYVRQKAVLSTAVDLETGEILPPTSAPTEKAEKAEKAGAPADIPAKWLDAYNAIREDLAAGRQAEAEEALAGLPAEAQAALRAALGMEEEKKS